MDLFGDTDPRKMPKHLFFGALSLKFESAERANTAKQDFSVCPRHWYIDATFQCEACSTEFVFSAQEQRFWYEDRGFYVDSIPRKCPACRKQARRVKLLKQQYDSQISETISSAEFSKKITLVGILDELASTPFHFTERMIEHRNRLLDQIRKQAAKPS